MIRRPLSGVASPLKPVFFTLLRLLSPLLVRTPVLLRARMERADEHAEPLPASPSTIGGPACVGVGADAPPSHGNAAGAELERREPSIGGKSLVRAPAPFATAPSRDAASPTPAASTASTALTVSMASASAASAAGSSRSSSTKHTRMMRCPRVTSPPPCLYWPHWMSMSPCSRPT